MKKVLPMYHWAPQSRRQGIKRVGLVPGRLSNDGFWRPPYVCLATNAYTGWALSGGMKRMGHIEKWDLWQIYMGGVSGYEELYYDNGVIKEVRVYERIFKRDVVLIGERRSEHYKDAETAAALHGPAV